MQTGDLAVTDVAYAQAIAAAVTAVPSVAALSPGRASEVATYGAYDKVQGVIVRQVHGAVEVDVHVCAQYDGSLDLIALAARVREATTQSLGAAGATRVTRVDVVFDDLRLE